MSHNSNVPCNPTVPWLARGQSRELAPMDAKNVCKRVPFINNTLRIVTLYKSEQKRSYCINSRADNDTKTWFSVWDIHLLHKTGSDDVLSMHIAP